MWIDIRKGEIVMKYLKEFWKVFGPTIKGLFITLLIAFMIFSAPVVIQEIIATITIILSVIFTFALIISIIRTKINKR